jgi:thiol-disulfide isomerase/thioredoxin
MKSRSLVLLLLAAATLSSLAAQSNRFATHQWHDVIRDVYVDGELDRGIQVLMCDSPRRMALLSSRYQDAVVLDLGANTVNLSAKSSLHLADDRNSATSDAAAPLRPAGKCSAVDSTTYLLSVEGKSILIRSHTGFTGEMSEEKLYEVAPIWRSLMETYKPQAEAVAALKGDDKQTNVTVVFGTWCPDSKNYVPKLLKALRAAGNSRLQVKLIGVDNQFRQPVATIQPRSIINVPIVIVERGGREIGRIVETPAATTIEEDLAAVMANKPNLHKGRWERGPLMARGAYLYTNQGGTSCGTETWEIYNTAEGGVLVHSEIKVGDHSTEVFHRLDAARKTTFVELTKRRGESLTRVRYTIDDRTMTARLRGNISGVVQQTLELPAGFAFSSPSVAAQGRGWPEAAQVISTLPSYFSPADMDETVGTLEKTSYEVKSETPVRVQAGEFSTRQIVRRSPTETSEWWLHLTLGVPVRGKVMGGMEYVLTSLEISPAAK